MQTIHASCYYSDIRHEFDIFAVINFCSTDTPPQTQVPPTPPLFLVRYTNRSFGHQRRYTKLPQSIGRPPSFVPGRRRPPHREIDALLMPSPPLLSCSCRGGDAGETAARPGESVPSGGLDPSSRALRGRTTFLQLRRSRRAHVSRRRRRRSERRYRRIVDCIVRQQQPHVTSRRRAKL